VKCAAFELPFTADDQFGSLNVQEILTVLSEEGFVHFVDGQWQWTQESYPADARESAIGDVRQLVVVDVNRRRARDWRNRFHERAVDAARKGDLHRGRAAVQVERLDYDNRKAFVRAVECDYYTDAITYTK
jgi:DEAD/DEAH box helicase domain-containing protein